ncbi:hypothetical protein C3V43_02875 [Bacteroides heparinolyticus]|uniref:hypothetical protein n=1 Tax=Prevotella heparinolytica TaxID=28113 RepID=UPI000D04428C|nr:hypothetical protein [Bacteroides heparinolyticus]AVM56820.1 hypothetical protein C3V43_02875 [Bacteroides heparinolyticus]
MGCIQVYNGNLKHVATKDRKEDIMAKKVTSAKVASQASKALQDGRSSTRTKSLAGSALSQREKKK